MALRARRRIGQVLNKFGGRKMADDKLLFGKLLGEIYRIQRKLQITDVSDATIHGLLNGMESHIDNQIPIPITKDKEEKLTQVLDEYFKDPKKLEDIKGYYDIEDHMEKLGCEIDRMEAHEIIKNLKAQGRFERVIKKFDSTGSPDECRTFEMDNFD
jgi:hypothetical protein